MGRKNICTAICHRVPDVLKATTFKVQTNIKLGFVSFFGHMQEVYSGWLFFPRSFVWLTKLITQPTFTYWRLKRVFLHPSPGMLETIPVRKETGVLKFLLLSQVSVWEHNAGQETHKREPYHGYSPPSQWVLKPCIPQEWAHTWCRPLHYSLPTISAPPKHR